jgi:Skp family chaperone for outer membrane proteins
LHAPERLPEEILTMLKALRASFLIPVAIAGAVVLPLAGCDKKDGTSNPTSASNKQTVGIIDYDRVFTDVGWKGELDRSLQVTQQDYKIAFDAFVHDIDRAVSEKKKEIAVKARLTPAQTAQLERNEKLDELKLTPELQQQLFATLQNRSNYLNQANGYATNMLRQRRDQLIGIYKQALNPIIRRVSDANGMTVVLIPLDNIAYYSGTADISSKVVDEFQKSPPPHNVPDAPKLSFPKVESISAPPAPTTAPAAPALPATQPVSPTRGG